MKILFAILMIVLSAGVSTASNIWVNNITVNEYNMTWSYTETYSGADVIVFRTSIDTELGDNDSFLNAWELLKADTEMRKRLKSAIDKEFDVKINNLTGKIEFSDIDSTLSPDLIGVTHNPDMVVNRYNVTYSFKDSIFNASSIWFLGQAGTPAGIVMPYGIKVINISGMNNVSVNISDHTKITGDIKEIDKGRGEITLDISRDTSLKPRPAINITQNNTENLTLTKSANSAAVLSGMRDAVIVIAGIVIIILIYVFKIRKKY